MRTSAWFLAALTISLTSWAHAACPDYFVYAKSLHGPFSTGRFNLSYQRPDQGCRTASSPALEAIITNMQSKIADPDLYRLFENSFPNTLDTAIKWTGHAADNPAEELAFIITGDINAMWLRDSANQMQSYLSLLQNASSPVFASLYRGVINLQARYILTSPYCNSFQPPVESGLPPEINNSSKNDNVFPKYNNQSVFECKYELDSLAAFLEISSIYFSATHDTTFFGRFRWTAAVEAVLRVADAMMIPTYAANGMVNQSPYTFQRETNSASETLLNQGIGNPVEGGTGLVRSAFRPSDDSTIYQLFIPANMMFSSYLSRTSAIAYALGNSDLGGRMKSMADSIRAAIGAHGIVSDPKYGQIYAYEIDGHGSRNLMDDANIPSLLSAPMYGYLPSSDPIYRNTRAKLLSVDNPYFMHGPVINSIGGPHNGPGYAWPMASIVRIRTSDNQSEIEQTLRELVSSTDGLGLIHESINTFNVSD